MSADAMRLGSYAAFGLPLAMVALPVYLLVPAAYAARTGLSLADIGLALLAARLLAAFADPWFGRQLARRAVRAPARFAAARAPYAAAILLALPPLLAGFGLLLAPAGAVHPGLWLFGCLLAVNLGHGLASVAYQSWGAALGGDAGLRTKVTASREACGLAGVLLACLFTDPADTGALFLTFAILACAAAALLLVRAPGPAAATALAGHAAPPMSTRAQLRQVLRRPGVRRLLGAFTLNGLAAGVASSLFLFYVRDHLRQPASAGPLLLLYFLSAAIAAPLWARAAARHGELRLWSIALLAGGAVFASAALLPAEGQVLPLFALVCCLCGIALGADLTLPSAALAAQIAQAGDSGQEGSYFGIWHLAAQLTLAVASGLVLPLLAWTGYVPGAGGPSLALALCYAGIPAALRILAAAVLAGAQTNIERRMP